MNIFEYAVRNKVRFPFKGMISVEDLWDLSLTNLDSIYKTLNKQIKQNDEESLLSTKTNIDTELEEASWGCSYARYKELSEYRKEIQTEIVRRGYF